MQVSLFYHRLADSFEDATGFNSNTPDSDGDGINDREEMENGTGPNGETPEVILCLKPTFMN